MGQFVCKEQFANQKQKDNNIFQTPKLQNSENFEFSSINTASLMQSKKKKITKIVIYGEQNQPPQQIDSDEKLSQFLANFTLDRLAISQRKQKVYSTPQKNGLPQSSDAKIKAQKINKFSAINFKVQRNLYFENKQNLNYQINKTHKKQNYPQNSYYKTNNFSISQSNEVFTNFLANGHFSESNQRQNRLDQQICIRDFLKDKKQTFVNFLNAKYQGQTENSVPSGLGQMKFENGDILKGQFINGFCQGKGQYICSNGSLYTGYFLHSVPHGYGVSVDENGTKYMGEWKNSLPNGKGRVSYLDGSSYEGTFQNNKKHGKGVYIDDAFEYSGMFSNNNLEGLGILILKNGQAYSGEWKNNQKQGEGQYSWPNGKKYIGQYKNNKRQGRGKMVYPNGEWYEGEWKNGLKEGNGIYFKQPQITSGIWSKGSFAKSINV